MSLLLCSLTIRPIDRGIGNLLLDALQQLLVRFRSISLTRNSTASSTSGAASHLAWRETDAAAEEVVDDDDDAIAARCFVARIQKQEQQERRCCRSYSSRCCGRRFRSPCQRATWA